MRSEQSSKKNLVEDIYASLKQEILWLRLKPGETVTETYLAEVYETSKTPVREVLLRLISEGLIISYPGRGYAVSSISMEEIKDLHEYRYALENACLVSAVKNATEEEIVHLDSLSYTDRQFFVKEPPIFSKRPEPTLRDSEFHIYLAEISGNKVILKGIIDTLEKLQRLMYFISESEYMGRGCDEHHELAMLIRARHLKKAQELLHSHINEVYRRCINAKDIQKLF